MNKDWKAWLILAVRITFGVLLIQASTGKILKPVEFAQMVVAYRIPVFLSPEICRWVGIWLPFVETLVAVMLIVGVWVDAVIILNAFLMTVFTVLVTQAFARGLDISCGCFAVAEDAPKIGWPKIIENVTLTTAAYTSLWMVYKFKLANALTLPALFKRK